MTKQKEYLYSSPLKCIISEEAMMQKGLCAYASGKIDKPVDADHAALLLNNIGEIKLHAVI